MLEYDYVCDPQALAKIANEIASAAVISLDLETTGLDPHNSEIRLISINTGQGRYVIDVFLVKNIDIIISALRESKAVKVGQNLKFDQKFLLYKHNLELRPVFDTYRASALIHNGLDNVGHNLWDLYRRELGITSECEDLGGSNWAGPLDKKQIDYAAEDIIHLPALRDSLKPKLAKEGLNQVALIEFDAILPEAAIELNGFYLDQENWLKLAKENKIKKEELRRELIGKLPAPKAQLALLGFEPDFNLDSPDQLLKSLHMAGVMVPDTKEQTLAMVSDKYPIIDRILEYRGYSQSVKSFGVEYLSNINKKTGRIHTSFYPFTGAGRYSSSKPNLQQIPRSKDFRKCFRAAPGYILVIADYSQIELRIAAELANDATLISGYMRGLDAHTLTASIISGKRLEDVAKPDRQQAKPVNFGFVYGLGAEKFVIYAKANYNVTMSLSQAKKFRERYFEGYSGIRAWQQRQLNDGKRTRSVRTIAGRRRFLHNENAHNEFLNTPVQGTGADGLKRSLRIVYEKLKKYGGDARQVHMVHDEIILEVRDNPEIIAQAEKDLEAGMKEGMQPFLKKVPVLAEASRGYTWADKA